MSQMPDSCMFLRPQGNVPSWSPDCRDQWVAGDVPEAPLHVSIRAKTHSVRIVARSNRCLSLKSRL